MFDSHVHTSFSADCETPMEAVVNAAVSTGIHAIAITDHIDYNYENDLIFEFSPPEYSLAIANMRKKYIGQLEILKGVELGIKPDVLDKCKALLETESFDFVIASMHGCQGEDFYFGNFFENKTPLDAMIIYLQELFSMIQIFSDFDIIGHIDLPKRYNEEVAKIDIEPLIPYYTQIFKWLIKNGKGIELNTSGLRQNVGVQFPDTIVLKTYYECGGRIITLGSDSHSDNTLCKDFDTALSILSTIGFDSICTFRNREVRYHPIEDLISYYEKTY